MINDAWAPDYLARFYFNQADAWITARGESFELHEMDDNHLVNTLLMVERVAPDIHNSIHEPVQETPLYRALKSELLRRLENRVFVCEPPAAAPDGGELGGEKDAEVDAEAIIGMVQDIISESSGASQGAVRITYMDGDGEETIRVVYPERVWESEHIAGRWYVRGFDTLRQENRTFRVDRILEARAA